MSADFNPKFLGPLNTAMRITDICHDAGVRATITGNGKEAYLPVYYETMRKLVPEHPALAEYDRAQSGAP